RRHFVPPAQTTSGNDSGRSEVSPGSGRGLTVRGSDVENSISVQRSEATRSDCLVGAGDVRVEAVEIAFTFGPTFAHCGHRTGLYHFEKIEPRRFAYFRSIDTAQAFNPRLHRRDAGARVRNLAVPT